MPATPAAGKTRENPNGGFYMNSHSYRRIHMVAFLMIAWTAISCTGCTEHHHPPKPHSQAAFLQAAENARMANEGLIRSKRLVDDWLLFADPHTGLIPRNLYGQGDQSDLWNIKDAAADNYPFLYITSYFTDPELFHGRMLDILLTETALTSRVGRIPDDFSFRKQDFLHDHTDMDRIIFGAAEYLKDGLIVMTELLGQGPWRSRMMGILDDMLHFFSGEMMVFDNPVTTMEVYGELLQLLSRIYWMEQDEKYLDFAITIGDYYLLGEHHPTRNFDRIRLRDHGGEIVAGLSELYATLHHVRPEKAAVYKEPLYEMLDRILEAGRNQAGYFEHEIHSGVREPAGYLPGGLFFNAINPMTGEVLDDRLADTWGYLLNAYYTVFMLDGVERYRDAVQTALENIIHFQDYNWERGSADGDADAVEGALYLYNRLPVADAAVWMDRQMEIMWSKQDSAQGQRERPDGRWRNRGIVEGWHGDGNFARTSLMHALWKSQGTSVHPWRKDVLLGAVAGNDIRLHEYGIPDESSEKASDITFDKSTSKHSGLESPTPVYLYLSAEKEWTGRLIFDRKRHRDHLNLPMDWPRLNQFCEWFTVEPGIEYTIWDATTGNETVYAGEELLNGIHLRIIPGIDKKLIVRQR